MKKIFLALVCVFLVPFIVNCQEIKFTEGTWKQILKKAKQEKKIIFIDVYTSWCGPCKLVAETVFPQEKVGTFYNEKFVNYRLDAEKGEGPDFVKKYRVKAYPSFFYIDGDGQVIFQFIGYSDAEGFIQKGKIVDKFAGNGGYDKMYAALKNGTANDEIFDILYSSADEWERTGILNTYLKMIPADKFLTCGYKYLDRLSAYDDEVMGRLTDILVKTSNDGRFENNTFDTLFMHNVVFPYVTKISGFIDKSIENGDSISFHKLLDLKRKFEIFASGPLPTNNDVYVLDRCLMLNSKDYLELCYWCDNRLNQKQFGEKMIPYMDTLMARYPLGEFRNKTLFMMSMIPWKQLSPDITNLTYMTSGNILDWADYYWKISPTDENAKKMCLEWIMYAYNLQFYNKSIVLKAVNLVNRLGTPKECLSLLEDAIKNQYLIRGDVKVIKELEFMLQAAKNNKL